jgi:hypothetical protein
LIVPNDGLIDYFSNGIGYLEGFLFDRLLLLLEFNWILDFNQHANEVVGFIRVAGLLRDLAESQPVIFAERNVDAVFDLGEGCIF